MEECISVFDMLKIGVGPSSSHTLGPWRAAERFLGELRNENLLHSINQIKVDLYGSLSLTGKGHATDFAIMLGLSGQDPETIPIANISKIVKSIQERHEINLGNEVLIPFLSLQDIVFNKNFLPFHANGLSFTAYTADGREYSSTYYSIGGGFVVVEERVNAKKKIKIKCAFPFPINKADELLNYTSQQNKKISEIVYENEKSMRPEAEIHHELMRIWNT
ncbi:MAG: L-serine ammonia-lyase, partial [Flavobacterium sp.]|nr:L-serine ammonia-lyase [Flavobacterium sp.]